LWSILAMASVDMGLCILAHLSSFQWRRSAVQPSRQASTGRRHPLRLSILLVLLLPRAALAIDREENVVANPATQMSFSTSPPLSASSTTPTEASLPTGTIASTVVTEASAKPGPADFAVAGSSTEAAPADAASTKETAHRQALGSAAAPLMGTGTCLLFLLSCVLSWMFVMACQVVGLRFTVLTLPQPVVGSTSSQMPSKEYDEKRMRELVKDVLKEVCPATTVNEEEAMCTICMEAVTPEEPCRRLLCKHVFHEECIMSWWVQEPSADLTCPTCRHPHGQRPSCQDAGTAEAFSATGEDSNHELPV